MTEFDQEEEEVRTRQLLKTNAWTVRVIPASRTSSFHPYIFSPPFSQWRRFTFSFRLRILPAATQWRRFDPNRDVLISLGGPAVCKAGTTIKPFEASTK
jgi:hypothetical protein